MPKFDIVVESQLPDTYRVNRVHSLFNVTKEQAGTHHIDVNVPLDEKPWKIGAVIGPSGTGKSTLGRVLLGAESFHEGFTWGNAPVIDEVGKNASFDDVTNAFSAVGLGTVPSWLRPFHVLSTGEKFRAELARILLERESDVVIDEFTSVVDRQIAQIGAAAFSKSWRRKPQGRAVVLSCHYDIIDWLQPDWVLDTREWQFQWRSLRRRPEIPLTIYETNWSAWPYFEPHHYLKLPHMIAATNYVAESNGEPVAHVAVSTLAGLKTARICRLVTMPEYQGAGVGMKFLEHVAGLWLRGENRYKIPMTGIIHTSHPGLIAALNRSPRWVLVSQQMGGVNKNKSRQTMEASMIRRNGKPQAASGYGGHIRAVVAFRYVGDREAVKTA
jgi:ABC-type nitrate/sulfonate/bicarbonate transport system ATPase subunit/GNAT superfamily N-acetyltransferase